MNNYNNIDEGELGYLLAENDENVKDIIYGKYEYIIDIIIKKYNKIIKMFKIDEVELRQEASYGFSDGINSFNLNFDTSLSTFLTLCIDRRVRKYLTKYTTEKANNFRKALSLERNVKNSDSPLMDFIKDSEKYDPLNDLTSVETVEEILDTAKNTLSKFEYEVFGFLIEEKDYQYIAKKTGKTLKQIDNTIQRIKIKLRKNLDI